MEELLRQFNKFSNEVRDAVKLFTSEIAVSEKCEVMLYKEYRGSPMIIKDGKIINEVDIDSFEIKWSKDKGFNIKVGNIIE